jgi:hypothetical protein
MNAPVAPPPQPEPKVEPKRKGRKPKQPEVVKFEIERRNIVIKFD